MLRASEAGTRQFLDIGTGIPTSPNVPPTPTSTARSPSTAASPASPERRYAGSSSDTGSGR
jgi:hypothetical protein